MFGEYLNGKWQILLCLVLFFTGCVNQQKSELATHEHADSLISSSQSLIKDDLFEAFTVYNAGGVEKADLQIIDVDQSDIDRAFQVRTPQKTDQPWNYSINFYNSFPVNKGEVVFASFVARSCPNTSVESKGSVKAIMMEPMPSYALLSSLELETCKEFRQGRIAFKADHDYQPAEIQLSIQFGYDPQTIETANIVFVNCGQNIQISDLGISHDAVVHKREIGRASCRERV